MNLDPNTQALEPAVFYGVASAYSQGMAVLFLSEEDAQAALRDALVYESEIACSRWIERVDLGAQSLN